MLLTAAPYDDAIVTHIRSLPERRYRRRTRDWCIPARREHLRAVCAFIGELEERGIDVTVSDGANARLARLDVERACLGGDVIEIAGAFSPRRVPALRTLPERRFDVDPGSAVTHGRGARLSRLTEAGVRGDHGCPPSVNGLDDLGVVDPLKVDRRDPEVGVPQLALD